MNELVPICLFLSVASVALFSFVAVATWSAERRKEREAYYRGETLKKIAETQGAGGSSALEFMREEDKLRMRRRLEGQKLGGLITAGVGIGLIAFLEAMPDPSAKQAALVGLIPLLVGIALLVYAYALAPKQ